MFFTNSGSESVETALKIALAYHRAKGNASKMRLIGRERGYHGVNFGGTSVGGIANNRKWFGTLVSGVDHLRHTHDISRNAFSRGEPEHGAELADDLERLVALHDASTIAAVIVEPVACSAGVLIPPKGYLQRLAAICAKHDILLIFDEVITAFGRLGTPFGADYFGVSPDIITTAKGITNGAIPMGAVFVKGKIHDAFMGGAEEAIDLFHGYTYSGHPAACAASIATLEVYKEEGLLTRAAELAPYWQEAVHSLKGLPHVIDIRNIGLIGAIEFEPVPGEPGKRAHVALRRGVQPWTSGARNRRHHRAVAAAHHREEGDRPAHRDPFRRPQDLRIERRGITAMHTIQNGIDGSKVTSASQRITPVYNPATGEQIAALPLSTAAEVNSAVAAAKKAAAGWGATPPLKRIKHMFRFKELLDRNADEIVRAISREHGKTYDDAAGELARGIDVVDFACGIPHLLKGEFSRNVGPEIDSWSDRQPLGVVAGITPFNFPAMVPMWMYPVAIACGNTFRAEAVRTRSLRIDAGVRAVPGGRLPGRRVQCRAWRQGGRRRDPRSSRH